MATKAKAEGPPADHGYGGPVLTTVSALPHAATSSLATGYGASFRVHGAPALALDLGVSHITSDDEQGRRLRETPLALTALIYPWPGGTVQPFLLGGGGYSWSHVAGANGEGARSGYAGGLFGGGVEAFLHPRVALSVDLRGFLRGRVSGPRPEPAGPTGIASNVGVLLNVGVAFYLFGKY